MNRFHTVKSLLSLILLMLAWPMSLPAESACDNMGDSISTPPSWYIEQCLQPTPTKVVNGQFGTRAALSDVIALNVSGFGDWPNQIVRHKHNQMMPLTDLATVVDHQFYALESDISGSILYGIDAYTGTLGILNPQTGAFTGIGVIDSQGSSNWSGLAVAPRGAYATRPEFDQQQELFLGTSLYQVDLETGAGTYIGYIDGLVFIDIAMTCDGILYGHDIATDAIYVIDPDTAATILVGSTGIDANFAQGMTVDRDSGTIYVYAYQGNGNITYGYVDLETGAIVPLSVNSPSGEWEGATTTTCSPYQPPVAGTSFFGIDPIADTTVDSPVTVRVYALDERGNVRESWSGKVQLEASNGNVNPDVIELRGGVWSGNVRFDRSSAAMRLVAFTQGVVGLSDSFRVSNPKDIPANLSAQVSGADGPATVYLKSSTGQTFMSGTDADGVARFSGLPADRYRIWAMLDSNPAIHSPLDRMIPFFNDENVPLELNVDLLMIDTSKPPVLVVPGLLGSTSGPASDLYPVMPGEAAPDPEELKILQGPAAAGELVDSAIKAAPGFFTRNIRYRFPGEAESCTQPTDLAGIDCLIEELSQDYSVYMVPWDWRMSLDRTSGGVPTAWEWYLLPAISRALDPDGDGQQDFEKVDIIAHGMGAILVRAFIQSNAYKDRAIYADSIDDLVLLGPPNLGATEAYYLVQGGDPWTADQLRLGSPFVNVTRDLMIQQGLSPESTASASYLSSGDALDFQCPEDAPEIAISCWSPDPDNVNQVTYFYKVKNHQEIRDFYQEEIPSFAQLLPTYAFLTDADGKNPQPLDKEANDFLMDLNDDLQGLQRMRPVGHSGLEANPDLIRTLILGSNDRDTLGMVPVQPPLNDYYPDGQPIYPMLRAEDMTAGDGRVAQCSAANQSGGGLLCESLENGWASVEMGFRGLHEQLFGNYVDRIKTFLDGGRP